MEPRLIALLSAYAKIPASTIESHTLLCEDLGLDSLDIIDLVIEIEDLFDIEIPDDDYQAMHTVGEINIYILDKKNGIVPRSKKSYRFHRYQVFTVRISNRASSIPLNFLLMRKSLVSIVKQYA